MAAGLNMDWRVGLVDGSGVALGTVGNPLNAQITGAGSGGTSVVDESAWTAATSALTPAGGVFNDAAAALTSGQQGTLRMTPNRAPHANLRNQAGTEIGTAGSPLRTDPTGGTTQPISAVSLPLPTGAATDRTTAAAPASVELSDGAAFYVGAKTGQLPSALVNSRLDVNMGKAPGTVSVVNSSTATLLANAVFTGTSEDVSGYALIEVSVLADQVSAAGGLSLQFSSDGTHWDLAQAVTISANAGAMFALCPCAEFFRLVYTNGAVNQGAFRLQTLYRPVSAPQTQATFQDVNAALSPTSIVQRVAADLVIQNAAGNTSVRPRVASDNVAGVGGGSLMAAAGLVYDTGGSKFWPIQGTTGGQQFVQAQGIQASGAAVATNPVLTGGIDGANVRYFLTDTSGRQVMVGAAAAGAGIAGNPVRVGISDGTNTQDSLQVPNSAGAAAVTGIGMAAVMLRQASSDMRPLGSAGLSGDNILGGNTASVALWVANSGTNFDRVRNNFDVILLTSAARTTLQNSANITVYNCKGIIVTVDVTATVSTVSLTPSINYIDPASGKAIPLLTGTTIAAAGTTTYWVNENALASIPAPFTKTSQAALGRVITINMAVGNANSQTYSIGFTAIP